jgi:60 kDa SS-A/Ro ribonucleoprotein
MVARHKRREAPVANKNLFNTIIHALLPKADAINEAGGLAYTLPPKAQLAQLASTGCLNGTFYSDAEGQLAKVLEIAKQVEPEFVAKVALHARSKGHMKDMPALLAAHLSVASPGLMAEVFDRVVDNPRMLRTFVQIMRSGQVGRRSLGSLPKRMVQQWIETRTPEQLLRASIGEAPSLADIIKMVHPRPADPARAALYAYFIGKPHDASLLPESILTYEAFKADPTLFADVPNVPIELLSGMNLSTARWKQVAERISWQSLRMGLNTLARRGVLEDSALAAKLAKKLADPEQVKRSRVLPYQLLVAFTNAGKDVPAVIKDALQDAMEVATASVPVIDGKVWVLVDVSSSMHSPVTGHRKGATTAVRCVDAAALVAACILRSNPQAGVIPFSTDVVPLEINRRDSVMTNARKLASLPAGGTNCSAPLAHLNVKGEKADLLVFVSDNESWIDSPRPYGSQTTGVVAEWTKFKQRNPKAKMVCIDLQPYTTTQAPDRPDVMNVGGFSDSVFELIAGFLRGAGQAEHWVEVIERERI